MKKLLVLFTFVMVQPAFAQNGPCDSCGPGQHWIDACAEGIDLIQSSHVKLGVSLDVDCIAETDLVLSGPAQVSRSTPLDDSANFPGTSLIDGHLDVIDLELVDMNMTAGGGLTLVAGASSPYAHASLQASLGFVVEASLDPSGAHGEIHVFFEIDMGGGVYGYNHVPLILRMPDMTCVPPQGSLAADPGTCIPVFDLPFGEPGAVEIGTVTFGADEESLEHLLYIPTVSQWGLAVLTLLVLAAGTVVLRRHRALVT